LADDSYQEHYSAAVQIIDPRQGFMQQGVMEIGMRIELAVSPRHTVGNSGENGKINPVGWHNDWP